MAIRVPIFDGGIVQQVQADSPFDRTEIEALMDAWFEANEERKGNSRVVWDAAHFKHGLRTNR